MQFAFAVRTTLLETAYRVGVAFSLNAHVGLAMLTLPLALLVTAIKVLGLTIISRGAWIGSVTQFVE